VEFWIRDMQPVLVSFFTMIYLRKGGELNLLNTKDGSYWHHSVARAFNQDCILHTSKNHFENKL